MNKPPQITSMDAYIASAPPEVRGVLEEIRRVVKAAIPSASETIRYRMTTFKRDTVFFYFAAFRKHIGVYPPVQGDAELQDALRAFRGEKGNLKFPLSEPIPYELIGRVATALSQERSLQLNPGACVQYR